VDSHSDIDSIGIPEEMQDKSDMNKVAQGLDRNNQMVFNSHKSESSFVVINDSHAFSSRPTYD
jgi:hypothetical protein